MTDQDKGAFSLLMAALAAAYREELDEAAFEGYWVVLSDLPLAAIRGAATAVARENKYFPRASELRELVVSQIERAQREAAAARRRRALALSTSYALHEEARRDGRSEEYLIRELHRVGAALQLELPRLPIRVGGADEGQGV